MSMGVWGYGRTGDPTLPYPHTQMLDTPDDPERNYRVPFVALLLGALGLTVLGQQLFTLNLETRIVAIPFILGGVVLFMVAYHAQVKGALPPWLIAFPLRLGLTPLQIILFVLALCCAAAAKFLAGEQWKMLNGAAAVGAWLLGIGLAVAGGYRSESETALAGARWTCRELVALFFLFVFAFVVRAYANGDVPRALSGDEGSAGLAAVNFLQGRMDNPFIVSWYSFPSLYFLIPAVPISFLGQSYESLRLPSALAGALTVVALYWFARPMFGRGAAAIGAALLAALNFHIHFSRIGLNNVWDGLFAALVLGMLWRAWQGGRWWYFSAAGVLLGLSQYFYTSARLLPLIVLAWMVLAALIDRGSAAKNLSRLIAFGVAAAVVFLPLGLFFARHPDEFLAPINRFSIFSANWLSVTANATHLPAWQVVLFNFRDAALGFTSIPLRNWYESGQPMLLPIPAALFILGIVLSLLNLRGSRYWLLLLWLAGVVCVGATTQSTPAAQRYAIAAPAAALMVAVSLATMARWILESWPRARIGVYALTAFAVVAMMAIDLRFYFVEYAPVRGQGDVNTQVAGVLGKYLADYPEGSQVYFFGPPRMGYYGFSTIPFLAPNARGQDVTDSLAAVPDWTLSGPRAAFVFLPEREIEMAAVAQKYPGGESRRFYSGDGSLLFVLYEVK